MKRSRILAAVALLLVLLLVSGCGSVTGVIGDILSEHSGSGGQSGDGAMPRFSEIPYQRPDLEAITADYEALIADLEGNRLSVKEAVSRLEMCYGAYDDFYTMQNVAELRYYHDITDNYYADETDWFLDSEPEMDRLFAALCTASANCADAKALDEEFWGGWVVDAYRGRENARVDPEYTALVRKENQILTEYRRALADPTVLWRGEERSYWELEEDPTLTESEWGEIRTLYYDKYEPILGEIYLRLVAARQELAAWLGYDSYEEYAYDWLYTRDYTPAQAQKLVEEIKTELAPLYEELSLNQRWEELTYTEVDERDILNALKTAAQDMGGAIRNAYRDMERYELYDVDISEKKGSLSYQCYLYSYDNPFIFVKTEGFSDDILSVGHEFGHFVDAWYNYDATASQDLAEVFSLGMEYLLLSRIPEEYREELTEYKLLDAVDTFTQQASFAAFEHEVYARPAAEWTPESLNELSLRLAEEYGYLEAGLEDYYAKSWIDINHFFESPFYVISYCTASDAAFRIYALECAEAGKGLECWNSMLPREQDSLLQTLTEQGGLEDPFGAASVRSIAEIIREKLG